MKLNRKNYTKFMKYIESVDYDIMNNLWYKTGREIFLDDDRSQSLILCINSILNDIRRQGRLSDKSILHYCGLILKLFASENKLACDTYHRAIINEQDPEINDQPMIDLFNIVLYTIYTVVKLTNDKKLDEIRYSLEIMKLIDVVDNYYDNLICDYDGEEMSIFDLNMNIKDLPEYEIEEVSIVFTLWGLYLINLIRVVIIGALNYNENKINNIPELKERYSSSLARLSELEERFNDILNMGYVIKET